PRQWTTAAAHVLCSGRWRGVACLRPMLQYTQPEMPSAARREPVPRQTSVRGGKSPAPVTSEIILGAFETICYEMATHVSLTATTPILNQSNERNATILEPTGHLAASSLGIA